VLDQLAHHFAHAAADEAAAKAVDYDVRAARHADSTTRCGTDGSEFGCKWTADALKDADIGQDAREKILYRNAEALIARATQAQREKLAA